MSTKNVKIIIEEAEKLEQDEEIIRMPRKPRKKKTVEELMIISPEYSEYLQFFWELREENRELDK